jgi:hypothetical protein
MPIATDAENSPWSAEPKQLRVKIATRLDECRSGIHSDEVIQISEEVFAVIKKLLF